MDYYRMGFRSNELQSHVYQYDFFVPLQTSGWVGQIWSRTLNDDQIGCYV